MTIDPPFVIVAERNGTPLTLGKVVRTHVGGLRLTVLAVPYRNRTLPDLISLPTEALDVAERAGAAFLVIRQDDEARRQAWSLALLEFRRRAKPYRGELWLPLDRFEAIDPPKWPYIDRELRIAAPLAPALTTRHGDAVRRLFEPPSPRPKPAKPTPPGQVALF